MRQVRAESQAPSRASSDSAKVPARGTGREFAPPEPPRGLAGRWLFAILAPACVALADRHDYSLARKTIASPSSSPTSAPPLDKTQKQLADAQEVRTSLHARRTRSKCSLAPMPGMVKGDGEVMYNEKMGLLMYDGWIAPPPEDKSYQLWVVPMEGKPISVGVFNPATSDTAHWMTKVPEGIDPKMFAVTLEPAGGMPQPTGRWCWSAARRFFCRIFVPGFCTAGVSPAFLNFSLQLFSRDAIHAHVRPQRFGNHHRAIRLLEIFNDRDPRAPHRQP